MLRALRRRGGVCEPIADVAAYHGHDDDDGGEYEHQNQRELEFALTVFVETCHRPSSSADTFSTGPMTLSVRAREAAIRA